MAITNKTIRIGTRGSPLALKQTEMVCAALGDVKTEVVVIKTSGDWNPAQGETRLTTKALYAKEIEEQLLAGKIDAAVHSMKDMDSNLPAGLIIHHMLEREDVRDCILFADRTWKEIPHGATLGSASVRRQAFLLAKRPDLKIETLRGNVQTRIDKLRKGQVDATLLALAGLKRLGLAHEADIILDTEDMIPCAGQGAIGIEICEADKDLAKIFDSISHTKTVLCVTAERGVLAALEGDCDTPIGVYAKYDGEEILLHAALTEIDGTNLRTEQSRRKIANINEATQWGMEIGERLKRA